MHLPILQSGAQEPGIFFRAKSHDLPDNFSAVWFKVAQAEKTAAGKWTSTDILSAANSIYTFTIPATLKAGQYLVRHEMYEEFSRSMEPFR